MPTNSAIKFEAIIGNPQPSEIMTFGLRFFLWIFWNIQKTDWLFFPN